MTANAPRLLLLVAHADDTEFLAGGTVAKFAAEGYEITEVIATNNERGSYELEGEILIEQSRREALEAARILGKKEVVFLDYSDGLLSDVPLNELREKFIRQVRRVRPRVAMTFDPWAPFEAHPDHRAVAMAATEAISFSQNPCFHPEHAREGFPPHLVAEAYYFAKNAAHANRVVDVSPFIDRKIDALAAHDSQMKLTIDELRMSIEAVGRFTHVLPMLDRENFRPALEMMIRTWNRNVAKGQSFEYGEAFRYEAADSLIAEAME